MSKRGGKVFVDTNILVYAAAYENENVFEWIHSLYEEVYIHRMVLNEMLHDSARQKVQQYIDAGKWDLFDPDDESYLSEELYEIYESYVGNMKQLFRNLNQKKQEQGRRLKGTNDLGEIHCLAAALLLSAKIICSNDGDIQEIIEDNQLEVASDDKQLMLGLFRILY